MLTTWLSVWVRGTVTGIRVLAALDELLTLLVTHPHLLGQVVGVVGGVAHEEQA